MNVFITICLTIISGVLLLIHRRFKYWQSKGIPFIKPQFPIGNVGIPFLGKSLPWRVKNLYDQFKKSNIAYGGFFLSTTPALLAVDPEFIQTVLATEFNHFTRQATTVDENIDPISANIFNMDGHKWRNMRTKITPSFTLGKIKMMFEHVGVCGKQLKEYLATIYEKPTDIKYVLECYFINVTMSCLFGLECNSFQTPSSFNSFKRAINATLRLIIWFFVKITAPFLIKPIKFKQFPDAATLPFLEMIKDVVATRRMKGITRNDFIQTLMDANGKTGFTVEEITAQAIGLFIAGYETSTLTLTYCLYELARHHDIQEKIRKEIDDTIHRDNGQLTFDGIMELKYVEQVIKETLRFYAPVPYIPRTCTEDFTLPNNVILKKGVLVFISTLGLHLDERYFENPDEFRPERFSEENKSKIHPFTYMPFGEGPRLCTGYKFAMVQMKVALVSLLKDYKIHPHESLKYPMEFNSHIFFQYPRYPVMLNLTKI